MHTSKSGLLDGGKLRQFDFGMKFDTTVDGPERAHKVMAQARSQTPRQA